MIDRKTELLAPAGDMERLEMALHYGADAVYLAGKRFGMRASAGNFSMEELKNGLFSFTCTDENGESASTIVAVRGTATSKNEANTQ